MSGRTAGLINVFTTVNNSGSVLAYIIGPEGIIDYSGLAFEMLPLSTFVQVGIVGIILLYNIYFQMLKKIKSSNLIAKGIKLATIIWLIIGCIECGYWLPPTAMNLFIMLAIGYIATRLNTESD
jgi:hypothetical protein